MKEETDEAKTSRRTKYNHSILKELTKSVFIHPLIKCDPYTFAFTVYNVLHFMIPEDHFPDKKVTISELAHDFNDKNEIVSTSIAFGESRVVDKFMEHEEKDDNFERNDPWYYIKKIVRDDDKTLTFYYSNDSSFTRTMKNLKEKVTYKFVTEDEDERKFLIDNNYEIVRIAGTMIKININKKEYAFIEDILKKHAEKYKLFSEYTNGYYTTSVLRALTTYKTLYSQGNDINIERFDKKIIIRHGYSPEVIGIFKDSIEFLGEEFDMDKMYKSKYLYFG
jgi:hypothetical protein